MQTETLKPMWGNFPQRLLFNLVLRVLFLFLADSMQKKMSASGVHAGEMVTTRIAENAMRNDTYEKISFCRCNYE